jgi:hypothetical protein
MLAPCLCSKRNIRFTGNPEFNRRLVRFRLIRRRSQELHTASDDFRAASGCAVALPLARAQATFDENLPPLLEILVAGQGKFSDDYDPVPFGPFVAFAFVVDVLFVGRDREIHDRQAGGRVPDFRVLSEVVLDFPNKGALSLFGIASAKEALRSEPPTEHGRTMATMFSCFQLPARLAGHPFAN